MIKFILLMAVSGLFAYTPKTHDQAVKFVSAKKVKVGIYDVTVAILDNNGNTVKGVNSKCDSVITVFGHETHIMKEPIWPTYWIFATNDKYPNMGALFAMDLRDYKKFNIPLSRVIYEDKP